MEQINKDTSSLICVKCGQPLTKMVTYVDGYGPICSRPHEGDPDPITVIWEIPDERDGLWNACKYRERCHADRRELRTLRAFLEMALQEWYDDHGRWGDGFGLKHWTRKAEALLQSEQKHDGT